MVNSLGTNVVELHEHKIINIMMKWRYSRRLQVWLHVMNNTIKYGNKDKLAYIYKTLTIVTKGYHEHRKKKLKSEDL